MYSILCSSLFTPAKVSGENVILVSDGKVESIEPNPKPGYNIIDLREYTVIPGLVDIHIHGINGFDTMDASKESLNEMSYALALLGVTSFLATTVTDSNEKIEKALCNVKESLEKELIGAKLLGVYLEGPYINKVFKGAHPENYIREIDLGEIGALVKAYGDVIKVFAIAPEKENAIEAIKLLTDKGIKVSLAHTNATYSEASSAIDAGAGLVTHLFNGMRGLHHREPGIVCAALTDDRVGTEIIIDKIHFNPAIAKIISRCKKTDDIILITDCIMAAGLPDGKYKLGVLDIFVEGGISTLESGTLAGSTLKLKDAVVNMLNEADISFENALKMATINPARALGLDSEIGSIEKGKKADIVAVDSENNIAFVMIDGKIILNKL